LVKNTLPIGVEMATRVRLLLQRILDDLESLLADPRYAEGVGLHAAVTIVVDQALELDSCLPENGVSPLRDPPSLRRSPMGEECPIPIKLPLDAARDWVTLAVARQLELNGVVHEIHLMLPELDRDTVIGPFAKFMSYVYSELLRPLHYQHPELEPLILGPAGS
jgi:hypothetical protein